MSPSPPLACALLIALAGLPETVSAQQTESDSKPHRLNHTIEVTQEGERCYYRIADQAAQDTFRIASGGRLFVYARDASDANLGIPASIQVQRSREGAEGTPDREKTKYTSRSQRMVTFPVRTRGQGITVHDVVIRCCDGARRGDCERAPRAEPRPTITGSRPLRGLPSSTEVTRGPSPDSPPSLRPTPHLVLGPVMRVEDN